MVGAEGFEPPTLCSQSRCATRLRYAPTSLVYRIESRSGRQKRAEQLWGSMPNSACIRLPKTHVSRSIGSRTSATRTSTDAAEKEPALQRVLPRLVHAADQQSVVAAVGAPGDVEHVAENRDRSDHDLDRDVGHHTRHRDVRDAANPGRDDDDAGGDASDQIADARDERRRCRRGRSGSRYREF